MKKDALILVRGGGDLATGTIHRLCRTGRTSSSVSGSPLILSV